MDILITSTNIVLASCLVAIINHSRGTNKITRPLFSLLAAFVVTGGSVEPHTVLVAAFIHLTWLWGWGEYVGGIINPNEFRMKEEPVTDFLMKPLRFIKEPAWGVIATSVRFSVWSPPLFYVMDLMFMWPGMWFTGFCWYIPYRYYRGSMKKTPHDIWNYGEYAAAFLMACLILLGGQL